MCVYIYIYIYRERERQTYMCMSLSLSIYIYMYMYIHNPFYKHMYRHIIGSSSRPSGRASSISPGPPNTNDAGDYNSTNIDGNMNSNK